MELFSSWIVRFKRVSARRVSPVRLQTFSRHILSSTFDLTVELVFCLFFLTVELSEYDNLIRLMKSVTFGLSLKLQSKKDLTYHFSYSIQNGTEILPWKYCNSLWFEGVIFLKELGKFKGKNPEILFWVLPSESKAEKVSVDWPNANPYWHKIVSTD